MLQGRDLECGLQRLAVHEGYWVFSARGVELAPSYLDRLLHRRAMKMDVTIWALHSKFVELEKRGLGV
jgi:hypothetical protein